MKNERLIGLALLPALIGHPFSQKKATSEQGAQPITISNARIATGVLTMTDKTVKPKQKLLLDDLKKQIKSGKEGSFAFKLAAYPTTCEINIALGKKKTPVAIAARHAAAAVQMPDEAIRDA